MKSLVLALAALALVPAAPVEAQSNDPFVGEAAPDAGATNPFVGDWPAELGPPPEMSPLPPPGEAPPPDPLATLPAPEPLPPAGFVPGSETSPAPAPTAPRVKNAVAVFSGIDKITGRIHTFDVYVDETVQFGALQVTPRVCYTSAETDAPRTDSFVEVDEITLNREIRRIFNGWMFADSPGLNAVEHPVYDVWLKDCKSQSDVPPPASASAG